MCCCNGNSSSSSSSAAAIVVIFSISRNSGRVTAAVHTCCCRELPPVRSAPPMRFNSYVYLCNDRQYHYCSTLPANCWVRPSTLQYHMPSILPTGAPRYLTIVLLVGHAHGTGLVLVLYFSLPQYYASILLSSSSGMSVYGQRTAVLYANC